MNIDKDDSNRNFFLIYIEILLKKMVTIICKKFTKKMKTETQCG